MTGTISSPNPLSPHFELLRTLLPRNVESTFIDAESYLESQCGFSDPGFTADQDQ